MNPLENNYHEVDEFVPLTKQAGFTYGTVECPNVEYDSIVSFFDSEGNVVYSPIVVPNGCN